MRKLILILVAISASACSTTPIPVVVELQLPPELELPKINPDAMACLSPEAYAALVTRDKLQAERRNTLRSIIETTQ